MGDYQQLIPGRRWGPHPDFDGLLILLQRYGVFELGHTDGCLCFDFSLAGVQVSNSCRKSEGGRGHFWPGFYGNVLRVSCRYMYSSLSDLIALAREVSRQVAEQSRLPVLSRLCEYAADHKGTNGSCLYCGAPRASLSDYLCPACVTGLDPWGERIVAQYVLPADWQAVFNPHEMQQSEA